MQCCLFIALSRPVRVAVLPPPHVAHPGEWCDPRWPAGKASHMWFTHVSGAGQTCTRTSWNTASSVSTPSTWSRTACASTPTTMRGSSRQASVGTHTAKPHSQLCIVFCLLENHSQKCELLRVLSRRPSHLVPVMARSLGLSGFYFILLMAGSTWRLHPPYGWVYLEVTSSLWLGLPGGYPSTLLLFCSLLIETDFNKNYI